MKKQHLIRLVIVIVGAVFILAVSRKLWFGKAKVTTPDSIPIPVKVYRVSEMDFSDVLPALGTIKGSREIQLKFSTSGYVKDIYFNEGDQIRKDQVIAELDNREALVKLEYAKKEFEVNEKLYQLGSIIQSKLDQSRLEYESANLEYDKTKLSAPFDGYIGTIEKEKGGFLTQNDVFSDFVDFSEVFIEFGVIEKDIGKLRIDQAVTVRADSFPRTVFRGRITSISPMVEGQSRTFKVRAKIDPQNEKLKVGMFGRVEVLVYEKDHVLVIPSSAFRTRGQERFVYLIKPQVPGPNDFIGDEFAGRQQAAIVIIEIRPIEVVYTTPDAVEIGGGLEAGDLIVSDMQQEYQNGALVEIVEIQEFVF